MSTNFSILYDGVAHNALTTGSLCELDSSAAAAYGDVMIDNPGPNDVRVRAGGAGVTASVTSMRIAAGTTQPFAKGSATHLGFLAIGANQAVVVFVGEGQ